MNQTRYLHHSIMECTNTLTQEKLYKLEHWFASPDSRPAIAGSRIAGYFKSKEEAENHHNSMLVQGLLK